MKNILNNNIYDKYVCLLKASLDRNSVISEDTARYLFYANAIKELNLSHNELLNIQQEISYSNTILGLKNKSNLLKTNKAGNIMSELDSFFDFGNEKSAIEFKHHREKSKNLIKKTIPHSQYAGEVFDDINRLSLIDKNLHRYFVYIMDNGMMDYKKNDHKCLFRKVFDMNINDTFVITQKEILNQSSTISDEAYASFSNGAKKLSNISITMIYKKEFSANNTKYQVTIHEIN